MCMYGRKNAFYSVFTLLFFFYITIASAQTPSPGTEGKGVVKADSIILHKAFFLLSVFEHNNQLNAFIQNDRVIKKVADGQVQRINQALKSCDSAGCLVKAIKWQDAEVRSIGDELLKLYFTNSSFKQLAKILKKEGYYARYYNEADTTLIRGAWTDVSSGINNVLDVYIAGKSPRYPKIDSISFEKGDTYFNQQVKDRAEAIIREYNTKSGRFYTIPARTALAALALNDRDEAARYEPLNAGLNAGPFRAVSSTNWKAFKYSFILVPGSGLQEGGKGLTAMGAYRCKISAERYRKGLAPFLIVSGGHVHPYKTPYCEAVEMKKYMVEELKVPADAVIIEPHARHTTTNIRNAERIAIRFGMPADKPALIVTDALQNSWMAAMDQRCLREIRIVPFKNMKILEKEESEFYPDVNALYADSIDPLDP